jgi:hypothetical protein
VPNSKIAGTLALPQGVIVGKALMCVKKRIQEAPFQLTFSIVKVGFRTRTPKPRLRENPFGLAAGLRLY